MGLAGKARAVDQALGEYEVLSSIIAYLRASLQQEICRRDCQDSLSKLATVSSNWQGAVNKHLYRNPFLGNAERGLKLRECLQLQPKNALLITKLIFGEGSDLDINDWKDPSIVTDLVGACTILCILGLGALKHSDISHVIQAVMNAKDLHELRACDHLPSPLDSIDYLYTEVLAHITGLRRLRLYGIISMEESIATIEYDSLIRLPQNEPAQIALTDAALNYCAIPLPSLLSFLFGSAQTLTSLSLEGPFDITHQDLVILLIEVGSNLKVLEVDDFPNEGNSKGLSDHRLSAANSQSTLNGNPSDKAVGVIYAVLRACPKLRRLDFIEGVASESIFNGLDLTNLEEWRFTCAASVRPSHWLEALRRQYFRRGSKARIEGIGWKDSEIRHVRIAAWQIGVSWLSDGG